MSGTSSVGGHGVYEAGDQRNAPQGPTGDRFHEGQPNSHKANDSSQSSDSIERYGSIQTEVTILADT